MKYTAIILGWSDTYPDSAADSSTRAKAEAIANLFAVRSGRGLLTVENIGIERAGVLFAPTSAKERES